MTRSIGDRIGLIFVALVMISPVVLFFLWMVSLSLKYEIDNGAYPPVLIPERVAWSNYAKVFAENDFLLFFRNSVIVTGSATLLALLIGVPAGYGIARLKADKAAIVIMIARKDRAVKLSMNAAGRRMVAGRPRCSMCSSIARLLSKCGTPLSRSAPPADE